MVKLKINLYRFYRRLPSKLFKWLYCLYAKQLSPPTQKQSRLIEDLRSTFLTLSVEQTDSESVLSQTWLEFQKALKKEVAEQDPRSFLRWPVILNTMFPDDPEYLPIEFAVIRKDTEWLSRWKKAIQETSIGRPMPFWRYRNSSSNTIHQAYHILVFEHEWDQRINYFDQVLEFGGGYGCLRRVIHNLGYNGSYCISDFPTFSALQNYYLLQSELPIGNGIGGTLLLSDIDQFLDVCQAAKGKVLFIANWSLSETPFELRTRVLSEVARHCTAFLIGYQDEICGIDNATYFADWSASIAEKFECRVIKIEHLRGNNYLMGWKTEAFGKHTVK